MDQIPGGRSGFGKVRLSVVRLKNTTKGVVDSLEVSRAGRRNSGRRFAEHVRLYETKEILS